MLCGDQFIEAISGKPRLGFFIREALAKRRISSEALPTSAVYVWV